MRGMHEDEMPGTRGKTQSQVFPLSSCSCAGVFVHPVGRLQLSVWVTKEEKNPTSYTIDPGVVELK